MARIQFTLFDSIADMVPGLLLVGSLIPLTDGGSFGSYYATNPLLGGLVVLALAYTVGRLIHGITGHLIGRSLWESEPNLNFKQKMGENNQPLHRLVGEEVIDSQTLNRISEVETGKSQTETVQHLVETQYYGSGLAWKYSMLRVFFRNMIVTIPLTVILLLIIAHFWQPNYFPQEWKPAISFLLIGFAIFGVVLSCSQYKKFHEREARTLVYQAFVGE